MNVSVVVPVYNSELSLRLLVRRLEPVLSMLSDKYEVLLINDGSIDKSWDVISELTSEYKWIRAVDLMRNYGQHNALLCGIRLAKYDTIVTMDDDLQHPPESIPELINKYNDGFDVVYGTPEEEQHNLWRDIASVSTKWVLQLSMKSKIARDVSAFRVFRTQLRDAFSNYNSSFVFVDMLLTWGTSSFASVSVPIQPRRLGSSGYTFYKLLMHAVNMLTGYSPLPLQVASLLGIVFTLVGFLTLSFVLLMYFIKGSVVPGFTFLATTIIFFSGVQLFVLGIIGEYLARIHFCSMDKPAYIVKNTTSQ